MEKFEEFHSLIREMSTSLGPSKVVVVCRGNANQVVFHAASLNLSLREIFMCAQCYMNDTTCNCARRVFWDVRFPQRVATSCP